MTTTASSVKRRNKSRATIGLEGFSQSRWLDLWSHIIRSLSKGIDQFESVRRETLEELKRPSKRARLAPRISEVTWSELYELPLLPQVAYSAISVVPIKELLQTLAPWKIPKTLAAISVGAPLEGDYDPPLSALPGIVRHAWAMRGQMLAFLYCQRSMSDLIAGARNGIDDDLFLAVRVDPTVLGCKTAQRLLHRAAALDRPEFFTSLSTALRTPFQAEAEYSRLDLFLVLLAKAKQLHVLTPDIAADLFIKRTHLYTHHGKEDPKGSLWRKILRWKKEHATLVG